MFIKCFTKNKNNKIELTEQELKELLDEVYKYGYNEGNKKTYWYTSPTVSPWTWTVSDSGSTTAEKSGTWTTCTDASKTWTTHTDANDKIEYTIGEK